MPSRMSRAVTLITSHTGHPVADGVTPTMSPSKRLVARAYRTECVYHFQEAVVMFSFFICRMEPSWISFNLAQI